MDKTGDDMYGPKGTGGGWPLALETTPGTADHGLLEGLADDDHPQYLTEARGDARYVNITGDEMTGNLRIQKQDPRLDFVNYSGTGSPGIYWETNDRFLYVQSDINVLRSGTGAGSPMPLLAAVPYAYWGFVQFPVGGQGIVDAGYVGTADYRHGIYTAGGRLYLPYLGVYNVIFKGSFAANPGTGNLGWSPNEGGTIYWSNTIYSSGRVQCADTVGLIAGTGISFWQYSSNSATVVDGVATVTMIGMY